MAACKKCRNPILFVTNQDTGRRIPVDAVPDEDGNVAATTNVLSELVGRVLRKDEQPPHGWQVYMPHHATCRYSDRRRKGSKPNRPVIEQPSLFTYNTTQPGRHTR
ncbi:hypothetical protein [uncultured Aeromicrobium sp.]|uniref:hypothetical protein n=1 Tax=uncultured Aeromicrobium sp. TaxID=337820 RepID=UPI0025D508C5|nr:hypothetical protein [uncultured Aeromicrobium sp.]